MDKGSFKRAIAITLSESEHAADPLKSGLMDYGDLQRTVRRLRDTLQLAERAYDDLRSEYEEMSERLTRSLPHDMPVSERESQSLIYHA